MHKQSRFFTSLGDFSAHYGSKKSNYIIIVGMTTIDAKTFLFTFVKSKLNHHLLLLSHSVDQRSKQSLSQNAYQEMSSL